MKKWSHSVPGWLFALLIVLAPLSKYPSLALPVFQFTSFRIGLYQLLALVFVLVGIVRLRGSGSLSAIRHRYIAAAFLVLVLIGLGNMFDAIDLGRSAIMTCSLLFLVSLTLVARRYIRSTPGALVSVEKVVLWAGIIFAGTTIIQLALATFTPRHALLCSGCSSGVFGFPRVNVFAAEPLFWANALLPFLAISAVRYVRDKTKLSLYSLASVSLAITLTFSRGAYVAVIGMIVMYGVIVALRHRNLLRSYARLIGLMFTSFAVGLCLLIVSATAQHKGAPYIVYNTARGMLEHLTLGKVSLKEKTVVATTSKPSTVPAEPVDSFVSQGLVEASTNERVSDAKLAQRAWVYNSRTLLFGVGLGNLGPFVTQNVKADVPTNLTVYIFYALFLVEMGAVGLLALLFLYIAALRNLHKVNSHFAQVTGLVLTGFLVQYVFFGSYINVVYIWLWLGIGLGLGQEVKKRVQS